jgi:tetratricopeptide (TPR) repeat protein
MTMADAASDKLARGHWEKGNILILAGKVSDGIAECREAIRIKPDFAEAHYELGIGLAMSGNRTAGIVELREAVRLAPGVSLFHYNLGVSLFKTDQADEAITQLREAIRLKPSFHEDHATLGSTYLHGKKDFDAAIFEFWEAISLNPKHAIAYFGLGVALQRQGHLDESLEKLLIAFRLNPHMPCLRMAIAAAYWFKRQFGLALRVLFGKGVDENP